ncbi:MAG: GNAT family N-acetyltransferase, partial [Clostridia bacterium]|nr:GNAT family N-acetyltransferase [Clostridia bacterium]
MTVVIKPIETHGELMGKAYVHWKAWHEAYLGIVDADFLSRMTLERCEQNAVKWGGDGLLIAVENGRVIGFVGYGSRGEEAPNVGEVFALYVLSDYYGKGVGTGGRFIRASATRPAQVDTVVDESAAFETDAFEFRGADARAVRRASAVAAGLCAVAAEDAVREGDDRRRRRAGDARTLAGCIRRPPHAVRDEVAVRNEHVAGAGLDEAAVERPREEDALDRNGRRVVDRQTVGHLVAVDDRAESARPFFRRVLPATETTPDDERIGGAQRDRSGREHVRSGDPDFVLRCAPERERRPQVRHGVRPVLARSRADCAGTHVDDVCGAALAPPGRQVLRDGRLRARRLGFAVVGGKDDLRPDGPGRVVGVDRAVDD